MMTDSRVLKIGEVARRTGVAIATLRAWERRYGLLDPGRTEGGHRLYGDDDLARVRAMKRLLDRGWSAGEAAGEATRDARSGAIGFDGPPAEAPTEQLRERLRAALDGFDAPATDQVLDDLFGRLDVGAAVDQVVLPILRWVGEGWDTDPRIIAREHFTSHLLGPRLLRVVRTSVSIRNRSAVAAVPDGDQHDLGVLAAAATVAVAGWNVHVLGASTPTPVLQRVIREVGAEVALVGAVLRDPAKRFLAPAPDLAPALMVLGGAGFEAGDDHDLAGAMWHGGSMRDLPAAIDAALEGTR